VSGDADTPGPAPVEVALAELDRRRRDRWIVGAMLLLAVVAAFVMLLVDEAQLPAAPWAAGAFLAVAALYGLSVVVQERRARRTVRALFEERERLASLEGQVVALETLHEASRDVAAAEDLPSVFDRLLRGAATLTGARGGLVLLRVGDTLTVAAADGPGQPEPGTELEEDDGPAWQAVRSGTAQVVWHAAEWGMVSGASTLAVPLRLPDRTVGALVVERTAEDLVFSPADRAAAALFAQQAALAVRNASRLDQAAERAAELEGQLEEAHAAVRKVRAELDRARAELDRARAERARTDTELGDTRAELGRTRTELARTCTELARALEEITEPLPTLLEGLRGHLAAVTGTGQLLFHRGDELPAARRHDLVSSLLEDTSRLRELVDRLEQLAGLGEPDRPVPVDHFDARLQQAPAEDEERAGT
jgi:K+-sensing histidine kinase KdpD